MTYSLYKLKFSTGLHIGKSTGGPSLDAGQMTIHSDTIFSALCCESVKRGLLDHLREYFVNNTLIISDALPYFVDELFLPKPIIYIKRSRQNEDPGVKKLLKSVEYIPLSLFSEYMQGLGGMDIDYTSLNYSFGSMIVDTRVSIKDSTQPTPYNMAYWRFNKDAGLYIIVNSKDDAALELFEDILSGLGVSGIGGKQSAGLGKFSLHKSPVPPKLLNILSDDEAEYQMLLGVALPVDEELEDVLEGGWYSTIRRGGYIRSDTYSPMQLKKKTIYALAPGSCIMKRFAGDMLDISDNGLHPVWRNCNTLFAGVKL